MRETTCTMTSSGKSSAKPRKPSTRKEATISSAVARSFIRTSRRCIGDPVSTNWPKITFRCNSSTVRLQMRQQYFLQFFFCQEAGGNIREDLPHLAGEGDGP